MSSQSVTPQLPTNVFDKLQSLAADEQRSPDDMAAHLINLAYQQRGWLRDLTLLRRQIEQTGGLLVGVSKEEAVDQLRRARREIFEAEYAHLYQ